MTDRKLEASSDQDGERRSNIVESQIDDDAIAQLAFSIEGATAIHFTLIHLLFFVFFCLVGGSAFPHESAATSFIPFFEHEIRASHQPFLSIQNLE